MKLSTFTMGKRQFVVLPMDEYRKLSAPAKPMHATEDAEELAQLPSKLPDGTYPAVDALTVALARKLTKMRWAAQLSQVELARRSGVRPEVLCRIEKGRTAPTTRTLEKLLAVLHMFGVEDIAPDRTKAHKTRQVKPKRRTTVPGSHWRNSAAQ